MKHDLFDGSWQSQGLRCLLFLSLTVPMFTVSVGLLSLDAAAKHKQPAPPAAGISLAPSAWQARYSSGVRLQPLVGLAGWFFDMPAASGHVNYITTAYTQPLHGTLIFTAQVMVTSGTPVFSAAPEDGNTCDYPAHARAYFEQAYNPHGPGHDIIYAPSTYRWWSNPIAMQLAEGAAIVSTPIDPAQWSDTDGQFGIDALTGFADALAHPAAVGLTFGAACFFGHGVVVSGGTAQFVLTGFAIQ